jgi:integrase
MPRRGRGEGSVYKRSSDGRWVAVIDYGIEHGRRDRKVLYGRTKTEVLTKKKEAEKKRRPARAHRAEHLTVTAWMREYLNDIAAPTLRPQTLASHRSKIEQYIVPLIGHHRLDRLEAKHIRRMYARLRQPCPQPTADGKCRHKPSHGLSEGTIRQTHIILSRGLKLAVREKLIPEAETTNVDPPSTKQTRRPQLTTAQADLLLASIVDEPDAARWHAALILGMRQGECLALPWGAINLANGSITIARSLVRANGTLEYGEPKSEASNRTIAIPATMLTQLEVARARHIAEHDREPDPLDLVWGQASGKPTDPGKDSKRWRQLLANAGLPAVTLHSARQSAARRMEENGVPERLAAEILGHSNVTMTYRYQRGAGIEQQRKALEG